MTQHSGLCADADGKNAISAHPQTGLFAASLLLFFIGGKNASLDPLVFGGKNALRILPRSERIGNA